MKPNPLPSLEYLNECFELSDESPSGLVWKVRPRHHFNSDIGWGICRTRYAGKSAGAIRVGSDGKSYYQVMVSGKFYPAHRVAYSLHHNLVLDTSIEIDHRDADGLNNKPNNLRLATSSENSCNATIQKNNTSGLKGVYWNKRIASWYGYIMYQGKRYFVGYSPSKEVIAQMIRELRESLHKEFTHH